MATRPPRRVGNARRTDVFSSQAPIREIRGTFLHVTRPEKNNDQINCIEIPEGKKIISPRRLLLNQRNDKGSWI